MSSSLRALINVSIKILSRLNLPKKSMGYLGGKKVLPAYDCGNYAPVLLHIFAT